MRDDRERLLDIQEAITRIERYTELGRDAFEQDELIQNWMISHLQIIGEACRALSEDLRGRYPEIPWRAIIDSPEKTAKSPRTPRFFMNK
jgi:uncharacterized protein with HEPN domain